MSQSSLLFRPTWPPLSDQAVHNATTTGFDATRAISSAALRSYTPDKHLIVASAMFAGFFSHLVVLRRGEWDKIAHRIFWFHFTICLLAVAWVREIAVKMSLPSPALLSAQTVAFGLSVYMITVFTSMVIYRTSLHRLKRFPGPSLASISNWYMALLSIKSWRTHEIVQVLHQNHGDYVRVGPTELSVVDPEAITEIYGAQSRCVRGPVCSLSPIRYIYAFDRNKDMHDAQRRVWYRAFGPKAIHQYDPVIAKHTTHLKRHLDANLGRTLHMSEMFRMTSFDIMAEAFYGVEPECLKNQKESRIQTVIHHLKVELAIVTRLPWIVSLGTIWPFTNGSYVQTCKESDKFVNKILAKEHDEVRLSKAVKKGHHTRAFDYFLATWRDEKDRKKADRVIRGDSDLFLIAGWDNQANMMATAVFLLTQHPNILELVRNELKQKRADFACTNSDGTLGFSEHDLTTTWANALTNAPQLTAVINETMRLFPSLAQGVQRMTPPEGIQIGDTYIPGGVVLSMPQYSLFRDARSFVDPDQFRPERWTTNPELVKNGKVFMPFGTGQSPCPGRHLATRMMRVILAELVLNYDFELAPSTTAEKILAGRFEAFNMVFGPVELVFRPVGSPVSLR